MDKKIVRFTPDQLGYKDRGKMKWLGLILSDHAEALSKMAQEDKLQDIQPKIKQSLVEVSEILGQAYHTGEPVLIQANILQNGSYFNDIPCLVSGTFEDRIFLMLKNGRIIGTRLEDIRHVEFMDPLAWHEKK